VQNRLKLGTEKSKLKSRWRYSQCQSLMMMCRKDFVKSHVLCWRRKVYSDWEDVTWQGVSGLRASNRESTATDGWSFDRWHQKTIGARRTKVVSWEHVSVDVKTVITCLPFSRFYFLVSSLIDILPYFRYFNAHQYATVILSFIVCTMHCIAALYRL